MPDAGLYPGFKNGSSRCGPSYLRQGRSVAWSSSRRRDRQTPRHVRDPRHGARGGESVKIAAVPWSKTWTWSKTWMWEWVWMGAAREVDVKYSVLSSPLHYL